MTRLAFGFMTGTSCDGLDAAAVAAEGAGLDVRCRIGATVSLDFGALAEPVRALARGRAASAGDIARLSLDLAELHAEGVRRLRAEAGDPDLVCVHGQTVFHDPPASWQLVNPWPIARAAGCPVLTDLRAADLAAGGQGAPITPVADWILFRSGAETRVIVNLGGFCNITLLPAGAGLEAIHARDVCACNHALDAAARRALDAPFDADGAGASRGEPDARATESLAAILSAQATAGRSLGSADEADAIARWLDTHAGLAPADLLTSATAAVASVIAGTLNALHPPPQRILIAGGSVRNRALVRAIAERAGAGVSTTADSGVDPLYREAAAMAVLGCLAHDGVRCALPHVTGADRPILWEGSWTNLAPARMQGPPTAPTRPTAPG
ncbi:MAG: anhydro-N-acetylmuramic acid kinase [Phycisphaerales bacterium JB039]